MSPRAYVRTLVFAALLGVPVALAAVAFTSILHGATELIWHEIPDAAGWDSPPSWFVLAVPALGGVLVALTLRLPGHGGHTAVEGFVLEPPKLVELPSILAAALASLAFGVVLGPEAPLLALGLTLGAVAARLGQAAPGRVLGLAGAFAAISTLLGGPFVAALMLFELAASSRAVPAGMLGRLVVPGFVAAGSGALVFAGVEDWPGVDVPDLAVPGLPTYDAVRFVDLAWTLPTAAAVALVVASTHRLGGLIAGRAAGRPDLSLVAGGLAVGGLAVASRALTDRPIDYVLFSGQESLPALIAEGSAGALALVALAKALAYGVSLGAGFRGGHVFPAVTIGVMMGVMAANVLPGFDLTPAVVAGIAAGAAASLSVPIFGALMAALLGGAASVDAIPIAIFASVLGWLVAEAVERRPWEGGPA